MKSLRLVSIAAVAALAAACSSTPSKPAAPAAPPPPAVANIAGVWTVTTESQMGPMDSKLTVQQDGKNIKGTMASQMGSVNYTGTVDGSNVKFGFDFDAQGSTMHIDYTGVLDGNTMKGKASFGSFGEGTFTAKKNP